MEEPIIRVEGVNFVYEGSRRRAIADINLDVYKGEFLVITGPTGAGKSTLCQCLNGIIPHFTQGIMTGSVNVVGMDTREHPVYEMAPRVGLVFQDADAQLFGMTVEEDIVFGPSNLGYDYEECMRRIEKALKDLNIEQLRERKPQELSGGQKQAVAIGGVYAMLPEIIIFDEPTSMLDPWGKQNVFSIIKDINKVYGVTIVLVEHEMNHVAKYADRVVVMDRGKIVLCDTTDKVFAQTGRLAALGMNVPQAIELGDLLKRDGIISDVPLSADALTDALRTLPGMPETPCGIIDAASPPSVVGEPVIEAKNLAFSYLGEGNQLDGVSVAFRKGDFAAVIGQNGAGKTTLMRSVIGLLKPQSGEILVCGHSIKDKTVAELSANVGYVFQNPDEQIFTDSVLDELNFGPDNLGRAREQSAPLVQEVLAEVGLEHYRNTWPKYLSKGERQRLSMGAIITMDPDVIIVDEPTTGQDWRETLWIMDLLKKMNERGKTILIITHNMEIVNRYCNRVLVMRGGQILLDGAPREVFTHAETLRSAYIEPTDVMKIAKALPYMPDSVVSVQEFYDCFTAIRKGA
ncbi:MAG TPA: energy-coupling factor transporter ATPase [Clostridia bacterium]|nr:energy-coupling factor transporter ATPase [Clostridia bacterium]